MILFIFHIKKNLAEQCTRFVMLFLCIKKITSRYKHVSKNISTQRRDNIVIAYRDCDVDVVTATKYNNIR